LELKEIEINISELELRLDRLRALYEQYFMGFEKLEPQVQRKDVDRRFQALRKENIRNTALRFRFNVAVQKYSTYQSYWQRICRQIEEGTYKRHVQKAKARFGDGQNRKKDQDFDIDVDVDLAELDGMSDDEFLERLHRDDASPGGEDDEAQDTVRPAAAAASFAPDTPYDRVVSPRAPGSFRDYAPRWEDAPNTQPNDAFEHYPQSSAPGSLSPDTQPQAFRPMSVQEAQRGRAEGPITDPAPPPRRDAPRTPQIRPIVPGRRNDTAPPPSRPLPVGRPASAPKAAPGELTEDRIRQIYAQYVREKRQRGESTATTTFESVAKSLRTSSEKLRGQHGGKDIDFEVAEKDGRTILRPIVK